VRELRGIVFVYSLSVEWWSFWETRRYYYDWVNEPKVLPRRHSMSEDWFHINYLRPEMKRSRSAQID